MAKSRKPPQIVNFDGEAVSMTRDVYHYPSRRRKAVVSRLLTLPQLEADGEAFPFKDERGKLLGFVSLEKGELRVDGNSRERTDRISQEVRRACGELLTFSHRMEHDEVVAELPEPATDNALVRDPDAPIPGLNLSLRELLEDPELRAQLEAQLPPGVNLAQVLAEDESDEEDSSPSHFQTIFMRIDLLGGKPGKFWTIKVPDWMTLGDLHRAFCLIVRRDPAGAYTFAFPDEAYESSAKGETHPDLLTLRRAFTNYDAGFYAWRDPEWVFRIRRARALSFARAAVELVRLEPFPPANCPTPEEYDEQLAANKLARSEPFESLERQLVSYADPTASSVGPYATAGMTLPSVLLAILLTRQGRPATVQELFHRAFVTDFVGEVSMATVRRCIKKAPFHQGQDGLVGLDPASPTYAKSLATLEKFRHADGPRLLAKRFPSETMNVQGKPTDIVLVVDDGPGLVHGVEACHRDDDGVEPLLRAVKTALSKLPQATSVIIDELVAREPLSFEVDIPVEWRLLVEGPEEAFQAMEQGQIEEWAEGGFSYPAGLSQTDLAAFYAAAQSYHLLCPWVGLSDQDVFEIAGLTPKPLIVSILGQGHEVYGLSLFESLERFYSFIDGDTGAQSGFMDFIEAPLAGRLREQLVEAGVSLVDRDTYPLAYGKGQPASARQFKLLTEALSLVCRRVDNGGQVQEGTTDEKDSTGRLVKVTFPVSRETRSPEAPIRQARPGRNDPCWCGSGKKYKNCHMKMEAGKR